jgi:hypothetical protein
MSDTMSISVSAAAIFSAEEGCGRPPPKRYDIVRLCEDLRVFYVWFEAILRIG